MEKEKLIEQVGEEMRKVELKRAWLQERNSKHLFELSLCEEFAFLTMLDVIEKANNLESLMSTVRELLYDSHGIDRYIKKGLIQLAEFAEVKHSVFYHVYSLVEELALSSK